MRGLSKLAYVYKGSTYDKRAELPSVIDESRLSIDVQSALDDLIVAGAWSNIVRLTAGCAVNDRMESYSVETTICLHPDWTVLAREKELEQIVKIQEIS
jgi:hypothetical protein